MYHAITPDRLENVNPTLNPRAWVVFVSPRGKTDLLYSITDSYEFAYQVVCSIRRLKTYTIMNIVPVR